MTQAASSRTSSAKSTPVPAVTRAEVAIPAVEVTAVVVEAGASSRASQTFVSLPSLVLHPQGEPLGAHRVDDLLVVLRS